MKKIKARNPNSQDLIMIRKEGGDDSNIGFKDIILVDSNELNIFINKDISVNDNDRVSFDNIGRNKTLINRIFLNDKIISYYADDIGRYFIVVEYINLSSHLNKKQEELIDSYQNLRPMFNNMLNKDSIEYTWKNYGKDAEVIANSKISKGYKKINNRIRRS